MGIERSLMRRERKSGPKSGQRHEHLGHAPITAQDGLKKAVATSISSLPPVGSHMKLRERILHRRDSHSESWPQKLVSDALEIFAAPAGGGLAPDVQNHTPELGQPVVPERIPGAPHSVNDRKTAVHKKMFSQLTEAHLTPNGLAFTKLSTAAPSVDDAQLVGRQDTVQSHREKLILADKSRSAPAASFVIDSAGIDPAAVAFAEHAQVPTTPPVAATAQPLATVQTVAPVGAAVTATAPQAGAAQGAQSPTPAPTVTTTDSDSGGGGIGMLGVVLIVLLIGGLCGAAFIVHHRVHQTQGGSVTSRLLAATNPRDVSATDSLFWKSAKARQVHRKAAMDHNHSGNSDSDQSASRSDSLHNQQVHQSSLQRTPDRRGSRESRVSFDASHQKGSDPESNSGHTSTSKEGYRARRSLSKSRSGLDHDHHDGKSSSHRSRADGHDDECLSPTQSGHTAAHNFAGSSRSRRGNPRDRSTGGEEDFSNVTV